MGGIKIPGIKANIVKCNINISTDLLSGSWDYLCLKMGVKMSQSNFF